MVQFWEGVFLPQKSAGNAKTRGNRRTANGRQLTRMSWSETFFKIHFPIPRPGRYQGQGAKAERSLSRPLLYIGGEKLIWLVWREDFLTFFVTGLRPSSGLVVERPTM